MALTPEEAFSRIVHLISPLTMADIKVLEYYPSSRRKICRVLPPIAQSSTTPIYASTLYRLVTVPAPWTEEEQHLRLNGFGGGLQFRSIKSEIALNPVKEEVSKDLEPAEIVLWVSREAFGAGPADGSQLVHCALRGHWFLLGTQSSAQLDSWWCFVAVDT